MQIKKTNKAKLKIKKNKVEKIYYDQERAKTEYNNYKKLHSIMKEIEYKNWSLKSPRIYCFNGNKLTMERAQGLSLSDLINKGKPEAAYYAGIYLGLFHKNSCEGQLKKCISYGDYNRTNIFVDFDSKTVWGIDPGDRFGQKTYPELDLMKGLFSILIGEFRNKNYSFKNARLFLKGYNNCFSSTSICKSFEYLYKVINESVTKNNKYFNSLISFALSIIMFLMYNLMILEIKLFNNKNY